MTKEIVVHAQEVAQKIFMIRGHRVMLDRDLAEMYAVGTKALNQAVKRNSGRFPDDFMFQLTQDETKQLVTNCDRFASLKHASTTPHAFTEQGVAMLSSVLKSERAAQVNIAIMRAFVRMKRAMIADRELARRVDTVEKNLSALQGDHDATRKHVHLLGEVVRSIIELPEKQKRRIGFRPPDTGGKTKGRKKE